jgi:regulator of RNase E activity RraB
MKNAYPNDDDGDALRHVVACGNDMTRPMDIDFFVVVPDLAAGKKLARVVAKAGYSTKLEHDDEDDVLTCNCTKQMLATYEGVVQAQAELEELSRPFGGELDGWGTFGNTERA